MAEMKQYDDFEDFGEHVMKLYRQKNYAESFGMLKTGMDLFPEERWTTINWGMCLAALTGDKETALRLFEEGLDEGLWWAKPLIREDEDLKDLQGDEKFERLAAMCEMRADQARAAVRPDLLVLTPNTAAELTYPFVIGIHGRNQSAHRAVKPWRELQSRGWIVALPQSSQMLGSDSFTWDDAEKALEELRAHYLAIRRDYPVDPAKTLVAGFSQGGGLALRLALEEGGPTPRFMLIAPYLRDLDVLPTTAEDVPAGARGYMITGGQDNDDGLFDRIESRIRELNIPLQREHHPDLAHAFPKDFAATLDKALAFLFPGTEGA